MTRKAKEAVGGAVGVLGVIASLIVLTPHYTNLSRVGVALAPGFAALGISVGFALALAGGYVIAASASRKTMRRAVLVASLALILSFIVMALIGNSESAQVKVIRTVSVALGVFLGGYLRTPQARKRVPHAPLTDTRLRSHLYKRMASSHEYTRHIISNLVSWYAFFVTVNYASMGWFASQGKEGGEQAPSVIILVSSLFFFQNVLGMIACARVRRHILIVSDEIMSYEQSLAGGELDADQRDVVMPSSMYARAIQLMSLGLAAIAIVWSVLPFFLVTNLADDIGNKLISTWGG